MAYDVVTCILDMATQVSDPDNLLPGLCEKVNQISKNAVVKSLKHEYQTKMS